MEHVENPDEQLEVVRLAISGARGRRVLSMQSDALDGADGPQHWKPDGVIGKLAGGKIELLLVDLTFASDDKLVIEDEILLHWERNRPPRTKAWPPLNSDFFDNEGRFTDKGLASLPTDLAGKAGKLSTFHPARYDKRYGPLVNALRSDPSIKWSKDPAVLTIAVGVAGWIPDFTWKGLKQI
jgi:hypothetical protein